MECNISIRASISYVLQNIVNVSKEQNESRLGQIKMQVNDVVIFIAKFRR